MYSGRFPNFTVAYRNILRDLSSDGQYVPSINDPNSVGSGFGTKRRDTKEIIGYSFVLESPIDRLLFSSARPVSLTYAVANTLWMLTGSDSLPFINFYNSRGQNFSDDGLTLHGAHGKRLFKASAIDQIAAICARLKEDPTSRRTVALIYLPNDNVADSRDIPCSVAIQLLQRDNRLHAIVFMRSQSAAMVLPYDVFAFTFLQEAVAVELNLEMGTYHHFCGSCHYYVDEESVVQRIIADGETYPVTPAVQPPQMPSNCAPFQLAHRLLEVEGILRNSPHGLTTSVDECLAEFPEYWRQLGLLLAIGIARRNGIHAEPFIAQLPPYYAVHVQSR